jgi:hypothetical protein
VKRLGGRLRAAAVVVCLALTQPAYAAAVKASFGVSVTVVATCRIIAGKTWGCAPSAKPGAAAVPAPQPVVTYSRDPKTGTTVETIEF